MLNGEINNIPKLGVLMDKYQKGLEVVKDHLSPQQIETIEEISPYLKDLVIEYGMGEIYARKGLDQKSRKIATIASLITSGNTPQIKWHISGGLDSGVITKEEIEGSVPGTTPGRS